MAIVRLLMALIPLMVVVGFAGWQYEKERLEKRILDDAIRDAQQVTSTDLERFYRSEATLADLHLIAKKVLSQFVSVEIYDRTGQELVQERSSRATLVPSSVWARAEATQLTTVPFYDQIISEHQMDMITVVPIRDDHEIVGYVKGVYLVPEYVINEMREDSIGGMAIAIVAVVIALLVVFPIIIFMQREHVSQTQRVMEGNLALLEVLGNAIAFRDSDTDSHNYRVTIYALRLASHLGISSNQMRVLIVGAFLHDIGKIGITDNILLKPGKLTEDEFAVMKTHVSIGSEIVRRSPWLSEAAMVVESHHEKYDGSGYPLGSVGERIPLEARIFAVVDVFDALTSSRPYKEAFTLEKSLAILRDSSGSHFDPKILQSFEEIAPALYAEIANAPHDILRSHVQVSVHRYLTK